MEFLDQRSLALIPRRLRWVLLGGLLAAAVTSVAVAVWLRVVHGSEGLAVALLAIFKASAIGTALWFFFMIGQRAQSARIC
jgi:hypothetical protein